MGIRRTLARRWRCLGTVGAGRGGRRLHRAAAGAGRESQFARARCEPRCRCWASETGSRAGSKRAACLARIRHTADGLCAKAARARLLRQQPLGRFAGANARPAACPSPRGDRQLPRRRAVADGGSRRCETGLRADPPSARLHGTPEPCSVFVGVFSSSMSGPGASLQQKRSMPPKPPRVTTPTGALRPPT